MKESGTTILFVSHSMEQVKNMCSRIIWLERGQIRKAGLAEEVCAEYQNL
jgi:ABC-2 type transport system ATP-binding protein/lipopolysaccharide transport system ATP-binding protein